MRILAITAGAANMYCGSCLTDNALAAELMAQGHDVTLIPLYTPARTDEANVGQKRVFFGGISVYLEQHLSLFRHTPALLDRLWDSTRVIQAFTQRSIATNPHLLGALTISMLRGEDGNQRKEFDKLIHWLVRQAPPDVVCLPNSLLIGLAKPLREALGRPVCCTLQGEDLFLDGLGEPWRGKALDLIRGSVDHVDAFLAVSEYYAEFMRDLLGIPERKMHVVPLGINLKGFETGYRIRSNCFTVGYFARVAPEKGLHVLAEAYRRLRHDTDFSGAALEVAGYMAPEHREYLRGIETKMKQWNLADDFRYRGELTRMQKIEFLRNLDVLCVPTTYDEPKGVFALEAMAIGVPVVEPRRGTFPEMIRKTSGGLLFEPDDPASLADALYSLWKDSARTEQLGRNAAAGVREHYPVSRMAQRVLEVYQSVQEKAAVAPGH